MVLRIYRHGGPKMRVSVLRLSATASALAFATAVAAPAVAQAGVPAQPQGSACQAPANALDKNACPDVKTSGQVTSNAPQAQPAGGEQITVVGSRIPHNHFNSVDPIQIVTRDETVQAGFNSTAEVLQSTSVTGGTAQVNNSFGGFVTAGGPGANTISLRGLGTTRTLVLLNGHRLAPAGTRGQVGAADLNTLPSAIVDRFEILETGASSVYGSDAIAGVINIVTRNKINGLQLEAQADLPQVGAGSSYRVSAVGGFHAGAFNVIGSLEYFRRNELTFGDESWARCQTDLRLTGAGATPGSADFIDPKTGQAKCYGTGITGESGV